MRFEYTFFNRQITDSVVLSAHPSLVPVLSLGITNGLPLHVA